MASRICRLLMIMLLTLSVACEPPGVLPDDDNTPPVAHLIISPSVGDSTQPFILSGSSSSDAEDMPDFLEFRWDFNNDSIWDTEFESYPKKVKHFTAPGKYKIRMEVRDRHGLTDTVTASATSYGINNDTAHFVDSRDGQSYRIVRMNGVWWMAENLNFGVMIRDTQPARNNGIYEKYCYQNNPSLKDSLGGYYTYYDWDELINYDTTGSWIIQPPGWGSPSQGLCPPGWEIPTRADWDSLRIPVAARGVSYLSVSGFSRLNLTYTDVHVLTKPWETIDHCPCNCSWIYFTREYVKEFYKRHYVPCPYVVSSSYDYDRKLIRFGNDSVFKNGGALPVRCVKMKE